MMDTSRWRKKPRIRWCYLSQLGVQILLIASWSMATESPSPLQLGLFGLILLLGSQLAFKGQPGWLTQINAYLQVIAQPLIGPLLLGWLVQILQPKLGATAATWVGCSLLILMTIPIGIYTLGQLTSLVGRLIVVIYVLFATMIASANKLMTVSLSAELRTLMASGVIGALCLIILTGVAMHEWGIKSPLLGWSKHAQWWVVGLILIVTTWFIWFNAFSAATNWSNVLTAYHVATKPLTLKLLLSGLEPGLSEEWSFRYVVLTLLLIALRSHRHQVSWALIGSALLFSSAHLQNLLAGQGLLATAEQVGFTFGLGYLLGAVYLYTGALWWPMIIHIGLDTLSTMASGQLKLSTPSAFDLAQTAVVTIIFCLLAIYLTTGQRGRLVQNNVGIGVVGRRSLS